MRFLIAPNAFKGTLTATEAASLIQEVLHRELPGATLEMQPLTDGGDGAASLLIASLGLEKKQVLSLNAIGQPTVGFFGWEQGTQTAYLDVSTCSGMGELASYQLDPSLASTYGTGLLLVKALHLGAKRIVLGLGGSATVDLGMGILGALGFLFLDDSGRELPFFSPEFLKRIRHIQLPLHLATLKFCCLCDVRNPFFGSNGAISVFGTQKGMLAHQLKEAEEQAFEVVRLLQKKAKKVIPDSPGFGAAGGIALGLTAFFPCRLEEGSRHFFEALDLEGKVAEADWIVTGEGKFDSQSSEGKATFELLQLARKQGKKIVLIASGQDGHAAGFDAVIELPILDPSKPSDKKKAQEQLQGLFRNAIRAGIFLT